MVEDWRVFVLWTMKQIYVWCNVMFHHFDMQYRKAKDFSYWITIIILNVLFNLKWLLQYVSFCCPPTHPPTLFEEEWLLMLIQVPHTFFYIYMQNFYIFGKFTSGIYEALELRDGGSDYLGKGVLKVSWPAIFSIQWVYYVIRICHVPWSFVHTMVLV